MVAGAVLDDVVAALAVKRVVAAVGIGRAPDPVGAIVANHHVAEGGARDMFDTDQRVVADAGGLGDALDAQVDVDPGNGAGEEGHAVPAIAAVEHIVADAAAQIIVAVTGLEVVVAGIAAEEIMAAAAD